jgi:hypothetical protein
LRTSTTAPIAASTARSLVTELDTHWLPDPWGWADLLAGQAWRAEELRTALGALIVPLIGKRPRRIPILDEEMQLGLMRAALPFLLRHDRRLSRGVFAYRMAKDGSIAHYRAALESRLLLEQELYARAQWVARADVKSFFTSVNLRTFEAAGKSLRNESPTLYGVLARLEDGLGYVLPEGYAAARSLSNICLQPIDNALELQEFTRWVDDYRVFSDHRGEAQRVIEEMRFAARAIGLELSEEKTRVVPADAERDNDVVSIVDHDNDRCHVETTFLGSPPTSRLERILRFELRTATARMDARILDQLLSMAIPEIPATALPRLAAALAVLPWSSRSEALLIRLLSVDDELTEWRCGRLAYAAWFLPSGVVSRVVPRLSEVYGRSQSLRPILLRVFARHAPELVVQLVERFGGVSARCVELASREARRDHVVGSAIPRPPLHSYL